MIPLSHQSYLVGETDSFMKPDLVARMESGSVSWDVDHSCRALAPIEEWVAAHQVSELFEFHI